MRFSGVVCVLLLAGCISPETDAPAAPGPGPDEAAPGLNMVKIERSGTVILRVPGDGPLLQTTGDMPCFTLRLPRGTTWLNGTLEWDPPQPMGLEYQSPSGRQTSWGDGAQPMEGPVHLDVQGLRGEVFVYGGPGIVGAAVDWTLDMQVTAEAPIDMETLEVTDSGC